MRILRTLCVLGGMLLMAAPVVGQDRDYDGHRNRSEQAQSQKQQEYVGRNMQILRMKKVDVRRSNTQHAVALVRTDDGRRGVVDLGPAKQLKDLELRQGAQLSVRGKSVRVGDRPVLMAMQVNANGQSVKIDRGATPKARSRRVVLRSDLRRGSQDMKQTTPRRSETVQGRVERAKRVRVRNLGVDHLVALVRMEDDRVRIVDMGPVDKLDRVRFRIGDTLIAAGDTVAVGDRKVLMARRLRTGNPGGEVRKDTARRGQQRDNAREGASSSGRQLRQYHGEISDLRSTSFRGRDGQWMIARLRTPSNGWRQINLGQKSNLKKLDLQEGDQIAVLARPGYVNGQPALVAQLVRANDQTADVRETTDRELEIEPASQGEDRSNSESNDESRGN